MRFILGIASALCFFGVAAAQCNTPPAQQRAVPAFRPAAIDLSQSARTQAASDDEALFKATGPQLFDMDTALQVSERTGKPVVCWMGRHIFADPRARAVSRELGETTIQAVMDTDGQTTDAKGKPLPELRVKFSDKNYGTDAKTAFIPVAKLNKDSGRKILQFVRGGAVEEK